MVSIDREIFNPMQTRVGYCRINDPYCSSKVPKSLMRHETFNRYQHAHVYGPKTTFSKSDFTFGEPGSNCPNGKSSSDPLLCKGPEIEKPSKENDGASGASEDGGVGSGGSKDDWIFTITLFVLNFVFFSE